MNKPRYIDIESRAKAAGYRNFASFYFACYYNRESKITLVKGAEILGVSESKFRTSAIERNWPIRTRSGCFRPKPKTKRRRLYLWEKVAMNTPFIFPWCAIHYYYSKCLLTTSEVGKVIGISQSSVMKLMRKYKLKRRKSGPYERR